MPRFGYKSPPCIHYSDLFVKPCKARYDAIFPLLPYLDRRIRERNENKFQSSSSSEIKEEEEVVAMSNSAVLELNSADSQSHHLVRCSASTSTAATASVNPPVKRPKRIIKRPLGFIKIKKKKNKNKN